jgi:hypothetical protein
MTQDVSITEKKVDEVMRLDITESDGYRERPGHPTNTADWSETWQVSVGELYGCVCRRPTKDFPSPRASRRLRAPAPAAERKVLGAALESPWMQ